ncbi:hypothetical protein [Heliomicrobium modesticaldum]|nr:hypothetical protein [Heliomicrobium modesticaldum]
MSSFQLLLEVMLIREKYTDDEIQDVIQVIKGFNKPSPLLDLMHSLQESNTALSLQSQNKKAQKKKLYNPSSVVESLRVSEPEKHVLLLGIEKDLFEKRLLPEIQLLKKYCQTLGIKVLSRTSRESMVKEIVNLFVNLSLSDIEKAIKLAQKIETEQISESDYLKLANYIIKSDGLK